VQSCKKKLLVLLQSNRRAKIVVRTYQHQFIAHKKKVDLIILVALTANHTPILMAHCGFTGIKWAAKLYFKLKSVIFYGQQILKN
jgi:hypothetical protein